MNFSFAVFLNSISGICFGYFFFSSPLPGLIITYSIWFAYSFLLSKISNDNFKHILIRDSFTYLPLCILILFVLMKPFVKFESQTFIYLFFLRTLFITVAFSLLVTLKILNLNISTLKFKAHACEVIVYVLVIISVILFYSMICSEFNSGSAVDLFRNKIWNLSKGNFIISTANDTQFKAHVFSLHFMPIYLLLALIYRIIPNFEIFYFLQATMLSLGILPIYWLTLKKTKSALCGIIFSVAYILHPALQFTLSYRPLWEDICSMPFLLFALYFLLVEKNKWFIFFTLLFLSWKGFFGIFIIALSFYVFLGLKKRKLGILTFLIGFCWLIGGLYLARLFNRGEPYNNDTFYQDAAINLILHPNELISFIFNQKLLSVLFIYLLPLLFLPLLSPIFFILGLPYFLVVNLHPANRNFFEVYHSLMLPFMIFASIFSIKKIIEWFNGRGLNITVAISFSILCASSLFYLFLNPFTYMPKLNNVSQFVATARNLIIHDLLKIIPRNSSVSATYLLYRFLPENKELYHIPAAPITEKVRNTFSLLKYKYDEFRDTDYVVIDLLENTQPNNNFPESKLIKSLINSEDYGVILYKEGVIIFKKGVKKKLEDFIKYKNPEIKNRCDIIFNNYIVLLGYNIDKGIINTGKILHITYFWQCIEEKKYNFKVLTYFRRPYGDHFYSLSIPNYGLMPPNTWKKGDIIKDEVSILIPDKIITNINPFQIELYLLREEEAKNINPYKEDVFMKAGELTCGPEKLNVKKDNLIGYLIVQPKFRIK